MAGSNFQFSASKLPYRPHTAKIQVYSLPPWQSMEEMARVGTNFPVLYPPPPGFSGVPNRYGQSIFSFQIAL